MLLPLMLMAVMSISAQSIIGTWKSATTTDSDGDKQSYAFTFNQGTKCTWALILEMKDPDVGLFEFQLDIPGTYTQKSNMLNVHFDVKKAKGKITRMDLKGELAEAVKGNPEMKKTVEAMAQQLVDKEIKQGFKDETPFDGDVQIKKLTDTQLQLSDGDDDVQFTRVK